MSSLAGENSLSRSPSTNSQRISADESPNRQGIPVSSTSGQGLVRNPSFRQPRPIRRGPSRMSSSLATNETGSDGDEDAKHANAQIIADLKEQVQRAEQASDQYRRQLEVMQKRLDDLSGEQTAAEERDFQRQTEVDRLRAEVKDTARQKREVEASHDSEKRMLLQERNSQMTKELELQAVISRLNETLRIKGLERSTSSRNATALDSDENEDSYAPPAGPSLDDYVRAIHEKDKAIEAMRIELAEIHLHAAQQGHVDDGRVALLEKEILSTKLQNARLVEENESFQMLLSQKTLKGDFLNDSHPVHDISGMSTLAEELEGAIDDPEGQTDAMKRLDAENKALKEGNKALTLYIDKIIGRLLQHDGFEHIILDKDDAPDPPAKTNKALPARPVTPPSEPFNTPATAPNTVGSAAAGFLQRVTSVVQRPGTGRPRPMSYMPASTLPSANENPDTAPSIPIARASGGHRRARSDQAQQDLVGIAAVVQQMNRGSPLRTASGGAMSPGLSPQLGQNRLSYFSTVPAAAPTSTIATGRAPSGSQTAGGPPAMGSGRGSSRNSIESAESLSGRASTNDAASSGQASSIHGGSAAISAGNTAAVSTSASTPAPPSNVTNLPGAVMKQNQLRPLRLVQEVKKEDDETWARKKANRGSWMGWFKGGAGEGGTADENQQQQQQQYQQQHQQRTS